ncbi:hypothetical protein MKEN_01460800 [Mycena kentingensis (nom. inval.)]|nr:hypothetical protein MKEN_01460800 [Mycena kentingensis (nom. inval.)]
MQFLSLPAEIILGCVSHLPVAEILRLLPALGNHRLWRIISAAPAIASPGWSTIQNTSLDGIVQAVSLASFDESPSEWLKINTPAGLLDFCISSENDLIVYVTCAPLPTNPTLNHFAAEFFSFSDGLPHPLRSSSIEIADVPSLNGIPDIALAVLGSRVAISLVF